jgi:acetoin utilization deacetylase AcuC-like enzyme
MTARQMPPIVFHPAYDAAEVADDHRFPMRKFAAVAAQAVAEGLVGERGLVTPTAAPMNWLNLVHDPDYVIRVLEGRLLPETIRRIGFPMGPSVVRRARFAVGGTCLAARLALEHGFACNTAGGSHHADAQGGAGYCVFNDVAVAAKLLIEEGAIHRALIIDLDVHQGDGTARIFANDPRVTTVSLHCEDNWPVRKAKSTVDISLPVGTTDETYLATLETVLRSIFGLFKPGLVFYNAGVDPHRDDRLGKLKLTDEGIFQRDAMVVDACQTRGIPLAGVLGGGYQPDIKRLANLHLGLHRAVAAKAATF